MVDSGIEIKGPKLEIDDRRINGNSSVTLPGGDINIGSLKKKKRTDIDVQSPTGNISLGGDMEVGGDLKQNKSGYLIKFPKLNDSKTLSGKADLKGKIPSPIKFEKNFDKNIKIEGGDVNVNANLPDADVNVKAPRGSGGFNVNMPSFGFGGKGPKGEVDLPEGDVNVNANLPDADVKGGKGGFHIGLPSLPKVSLKGKGVKADGDIDVDLPEGDLHVNAEAPDVNVKAPKGSGGFHIGMPKFGIKGKGPKGDIDLPEGEVNVDANLPDVDVKGPKGSGGFNVNLPSFGIKGKGPKGEVELPDANVDVDANLPDADIDVKGSKGELINSFSCLSLSMHLSFNFFLSFHFSFLLFLSFLQLFRVFSTFCIQKRIYFFHQNSI